MAKTLKQLDNGIRVKYLVKPKKYYLFFGSGHISVGGVYHDGFDTQEEAEIFAENLIGVGMYRTTN